MIPHPVKPATSSEETSPRLQVQHYSYLITLSH